MGLEDDVVLTSTEDKVNLVFKMFDKNRDGKISRGELGEVLQALDRKTWTPQNVDLLLKQADTNGDGDLQFTEFWAWVCGHGKKEQGHAATQEGLLAKAVEEERGVRHGTKAKHDRWESRMAEKAKRDAAEARKAEERAAGTRIGREQFVADRIALGLNKDVATRLFRIADDDRDGEVDHEEMAWMAAAETSSVSQIKGLFQEACQPEPGERDPAMRQVVEAFARWDGDGDGTISAEELEKVIAILNPDLGEKTVAMIIKEADTSKDGVVDINEFVNWLCGGNPKKKKDQEERQSKIAVALHRKRSEEAAKLKLQGEFEELLHQQLPAWCQKTKVKPVCEVLNPASAKECKECGAKHAWLCHGCGFVSFYADCINSCAPGKAGWTCLFGKCQKGCGCKKKPDHWQRKGFVPELDLLTASVPTILKRARGEEEAAAAATEEEGLSPSAEGAAPAEAAAAPEGAAASPADGQPAEQPAPAEPAPVDQA